MSERPELMGTADVAAHLGVTRQRVLQLMHEDVTFPSPVVLKMGQVWFGAEVRRWAAEHRPGRR